MAHFIEHLSFKGTERRRAHHITNGLERVGGDLNAFTNKQETVYCATVLKQDFGRAADLLTDIVFHSTYPQNEINREVEVICDEIDSYRDSPSELIFDEFESMLFENNGLGRDILGQAERLRTYTTADARRFTDKYYRPENAVFYVYGDVDFKTIVRTLNRYLPASGETPIFPDSIGATPAVVHEERERVVQRDTHQAHVLVGMQTFGGNDLRRFPMLLLNNMLGGPGMNSRLNMSLRERAGLVYSVDASLNTYPDAGWWAVYFGCDAHDIKRCRRLVNRELRRFIDENLRLHSSPPPKNSFADRLASRATISRTTPLPWERPMPIMPRTTNQRRFTSASCKYLPTICKTWLPKCITPTCSPR